MLFKDGGVTTVSGEGLRACSPLVSCWAWAWVLVIHLPSGVWVRQGIRNSSLRGTLPVLMLWVVETFSWVNLR